ncbi:MAG: hypothetical protein KatS3mg102_0259 [Planctomycetota bacterium]|nr:MAG: hypothetical protein KatS3mg102_0259 [Planctomycetota bacterium]
MGRGPAGGIARGAQVAGTGGRSGAEGCGPAGAGGRAATAGRLPVRVGCQAAGPVRVRSRRWARGVLALAGTLVLVAAARAEDYPVLRPGEPVAGWVFTPAAPGEPQYRTFVFDVQDDVMGARLVLEAPADLDLHVGERDMESYEEDAIASSQEAGGHEVVLLVRDGEPPLRSQRYYVDVAYQRDKAPVRARGEPVTKVPFVLRLELFRRRVDGTLSPGMPLEGTIEPRQGSWRTYTVEVPARTPVLRLDLISNAADLDLRVRRGAPMVCDADADYRAASPAGVETLLIRPERGAAALPPGRWYVDVVDYAWLEWPSRFVIVASFGEQPPAALLALPPLPRPNSPLERALRATVELLHEDGGGSGVLISEQGYILTNHHVVEAAVAGGAEAARSLLVSVTLDPHELPRAMFRAEVVAHDRELDLALLRVSGGLFGQPLPEGYRFPCTALGDPGALGVGDPLMCIGYPDIGGLGTRVSVTVTRGILSGFERRGAEVHLKTDAEINAGNSGGAVVNERFELVGIATETISEEGGNGQIGYVRPLSLVPAAWWARAGVQR